MWSKSISTQVVIGTFSVLFLLVLCQPLLAEYTDPQGRFSMQPPDGWQARTLDDESGIVVFKEPDGVTSLMVLPVVAESATLEGMPSEYEQLMKEAQPGVTLKVLEETRVAISGQQALRREYVIERGVGERAKTMATFIKLGNLSLTLAGTCGEEEFAKFKPVFSKSMQSLRFTETSRALTSVSPPKVELAPKIQTKLNILDQARRAGLLSDKEYTIKREGLEDQLRVVEPTLDKSGLTIENGLMSVNVSGVPLSTVLGDIEKRYGITVNVTPSRYALDSTVTTSFQDVSVQEGLARIVPENVIVDIVARGEDIVLTGRRGDKKGKQDRDITGLFNKGEAPPIRDLRIVKIPSTETMIPNLEGKPRTKIPPAELGVVGPIDKTPRDVEKLKGIYMRLRLILTRRRLEVESVAVIPGPLAPSPVVTGDHVYEVLLGGETLAVGTFENPMIQRAYGPEGGLRVSERAYGNFAVDIPEIPLDLDAMENLIVRVYSIPPGVQIMEIDAKTMRSFQKQLELLAETPEGAVAKVLVPKLKDHLHMR